MAAIMLEERQFIDRPTFRKGESPESNDMVVNSIEFLRRELDDLHNKFNQATEPVLVDSLIYEIQAVQLRYTYYLEICKERDLVCENYAFRTREVK